MFTSVAPVPGTQWVLSENLWAGEWTQTGSGFAYGGAALPCGVGQASCFSDAQRMSGLITIYSVIIGLTATCSKGKPLNKGFALVFWKGKENLEQTNLLSINGHFQLRTPAI